MKKRKIKSPRRRLDGLWRKAVLAVYGNRCEICGLTGKGLNAHHIISRNNYSTRWDALNGVILCPKHHTFDSKFSAHRNPLRFIVFMIEKRGILWKDKLLEQAQKDINWREEAGATENLLRGIIKLIAECQHQEQEL